MVGFSKNIGSYYPKVTVHAVKGLIVSNLNDVYSYTNNTNLYIHIDLSTLTAYEYLSCLKLKFQVNNCNPNIPIYLKKVIDNTKNNELLYSSEDKGEITNPDITIYTSGHYNDIEFDITNIALTELSKGIKKISVRLMIGIDEDTLIYLNDLDKILNGKIEIKNDLVTLKTLDSDTKLIYNNSQDSYYLLSKPFTFTYKDMVINNHIIINNNKYGEIISHKIFNCILDITKINNEKIILKDEIGQVFIFYLMNNTLNYYYCYDNNGIIIYDSENDNLEYIINGYKYELDFNSRKILKITKGNNILVYQYNSDSSVVTIKKGKNDDEGKTIESSLTEFIIVEPFRIMCHSNKKEILIEYTNSKISTIFELKKDYNNDYSLPEYSLQITYSIDILYEMLINGSYLYHVDINADYEFYLENNQTKEILTFTKNDIYNSVYNNYNYETKKYYNINNEIIYNVEERKGKPIKKTGAFKDENGLTKQINLMVDNLYNDYNFNDLAIKNSYTFTNLLNGDKVIENNYFSNLSSKEYLFKSNTNLVERTISRNLDLSGQPNEVLTICLLSKNIIKNNNEYFKIEINVEYNKNDGVEIKKYELDCNNYFNEYHFSTMKIYTLYNYSNIELKIIYKGVNEARFSNIFISKTRSNSRVIYDDDMKIVGIGSNEKTIMLNQGAFGTENRTAYYVDNLGNIVFETYKNENIKEKINYGKNVKTIYTYNENDLIENVLDINNNFKTVENYAYDADDNISSYSKNDDKEYYFNEFTQERLLNQKICSNGLLVKEQENVLTLSDKEITKVYQMDNLIESNKFNYNNGLLKNIKSFDINKYQITYDKNNRVENIKLDGKEYEKYTYSSNELDEIKTKEYNYNNIIEFKYDEQGRLQKVYKTNYLGNNKKLIALYEYDNLNRIKTVTNTNNQIEHSYDFDEYGNLIKDNRIDLVVTHNYDCNNKVLSTHNKFQNDNKIYNYTYNDAEINVEQLFRKMTSNKYCDYYFPNEKKMTLFGSLDEIEEIITFDENLKRNIGQTNNNYCVTSVNTSSINKVTGRYYDSQYYSNYDYLNEIKESYGILRFQNISYCENDTLLIDFLYNENSYIQKLQLSLSSNDKQLKVILEKSNEDIVVYNTGIYIDYNEWHILGFINKHNESKCQVIYNNKILEFSYESSKEYQQMRIYQEAHLDAIKFKYAFFEYGSINIDKKELNELYNEFDCLFNKNTYYDHVSTLTYDVFDERLDKVTFNKTFKSYKGKEPIIIYTDESSANDTQRYFKYDKDLKKYCYKPIEKYHSFLKYNLSSTSGKLLISSYVKLQYFDDSLNNTIFTILKENNEVIKITYSNECFNIYINEELSRSIKYKLNIKDFYYLKLYVKDNLLVLKIKNSQYNIEKPFIDMSNIDLIVGNDRANNVFNGLFSDLVYGYVDTDIDTTKQETNYINNYDEIGRLRNKIIKTPNNQITTTYSYYDTPNDDGTKKHNPLVNRIKNYDNSEEIISYDDNNSIIKRVLIKDNTITKITNYTYDSFNRLIEEIRYETSSSNTLEETYKGVYEYDSFGNLINKKTYKNGELKKDLVLTFDLYDDNSLDSVVEKVSGEKYTNVYVPNSVYLESIGNKTIEYQGKNIIRFGNNYYTYDTLGKRVKKVTENNEVYNYIYDNDNLVRQISDNITIDYIYNNTLLEGLRYNNEEYYYVRDITGCIEKIIDKDKKEMVLYTYTSYGEVEATINTSLSTSEQIVANILMNNNGFVYKGYYYDVETNLFLVSSRYYSPELCRWISPDDIEYLDPESVNGLNLYCYCFNNPINYIDPDGHFPITTLLIATLIGAAIGTAIEVGKQIYDGGNWNWDPSTWNPWEIGKAALIGAASGLAYGLGGIAGGIVRGSVKALTIAGKALTVSQSVGVLLGAAAATSFVAGFGGYALHTAGTPEDDFNFFKGISEGLGQSVKGLLSFGTGGMFGASGVWKFGQKIPVGKQIVNAMYRGAARFAANYIPNYVIDGIF